MRLKKIISRNKYKTCLFTIIPILLILFVMQSCSLRLVPVQMARVNQMEFYKQYYTFVNAQHARDVLSKLIGQKNWDVFQKNYARGDVVQDLLTGRIEVRGAFTLIISLVPTNLDSFFIDGIGRYFLVRKGDTTDDDLIMLTGDYNIKNKRFAISDMKRDTLRVDIKQYTLRYFAPNQAHYYNDVSIEFKMHMETISEKNRIYSLNYDIRHEVLFENQVIGYLEFDDSTPPVDKLIDLRGVGWVRNDYAQILDEYNEHKDRQTSE